jgi:glycyl-tRNA synthetase
MDKPVALDKLVSLCKRRGFIFPSSEIYGGINSCWDYGPLGVELKNNIKRAWWRSLVQLRDDVVGLDASIIMAPEVWRASGHLENFTDPLVECTVCHRRFRADDLTPEGACPVCGGAVGPARHFNLMFKTFLGPVEDDAAVVYLRPETAQGIFVNFLNVQKSTGRRLPFGIAQTGKSFRNEISPGNFIFRSREFEQMECEYFVRPEAAPAAYEQWKQDRYAWYLDLGIPSMFLRLREHAAAELAHYSKGTTDIEFLFPWGWGELEGIAHRGDYDLAQHARYSGKDLSYVDDLTNERFLPHVVEPAAGVDRSLLAFLVAAYDEEPDKEGLRTVLRLHHSLAPIKVAVLPLSKKESLCAVAREVASLLRPQVMTAYDETASIGKRYRRQDEIGTPFCVTIDFDTLDDRAVTVRARDTMAQVRIPIDNVVAYMSAALT